MVKGFPPDGFLSRGRPWCKRNVDHLPIRWQRVGENRGFQRRFGFSCWQKEWHHQLWMGLFWPLINGGMGLSSRENAGCFKRQSFFTRCRDLQTFEMIFHPEWSFTQLLLMLQKCVHQLRFGDIYPTKFNKAIMGNFPMIYRVLCTYIYIYIHPQVVIGDEASTDVLQPGVPTSSRSGGDFERLIPGTSLPPG